MKKLLLTVAFCASQQAFAISPVQYSYECTVGGAHQWFNSTISNDAAAQAAANCNENVRSHYTGNNCGLDPSALATLTPPAVEDGQTVQGTMAIHYNYTCGTLINDTVYGTYTCPTGSWAGGWTCH